MLNLLLSLSLSWSSIAASSNSYLNFAFSFSFLLFIIIPTFNRLCLFSLLNLKIQGHLSIAIYNTRKTQRRRERETKKERKRESWRELIEEWEKRRDQSFKRKKDKGKGKGKGKRNVCWTTFHFEGNKKKKVLMTTKKFLAQTLMYPLHYNFSKCTYTLRTCICVQSTMC